MYDDFLLSNSVSGDSLESNFSSDLDTLFDNLTSDINNFNKYIENINRQKQENNVEVRELIEERQRIAKAKLDFEEYVKTKNKEYENKMNQADEYLESQKKNIMKAEVEFKTNMDNSLNELELEKKELEIQREKFNEEREQFETYKKLELERILHSQEIFESEKKQFEKYKEVCSKKIELENKNLEQKCDKFKELIQQFNSNFKPIMEEE